MTEFKLHSMHIENFKCFKNIDIAFGDYTKIGGCNGSGKSSILDAFCWVLFNTDGKGNAPGGDNFREKPLDVGGLEVHYLDTVVEMDCTLNGMAFKLKRLQRENWTKKRGFVDETYGGNESLYWVNGIETKKQDFQKRIAEIAPSEILKVLACVGEFNRRNWKERRSVLLQLVDSDIDAILLADDDYRRVADAVTMSGVTVEEQRKLTQDRIKAINNELRLCPVRIDEATKALPDVDERKLKDANYMIADAEKDIANIEQMIIAARSDRDANAVHAQIASLEMEAATIKREMESAHRLKVVAANEQVARVQNEVQRLALYRRDMEKQLTTAKDNEEILSSIRDALRGEFAKVKGAQAERQTTCSQCGQELPAELAEELYQNAVAARKSTLEDIRVRGKEAAAKLDESQNKVGKIIKDLDDLTISQQKAERDYQDAVKASRELSVSADYTISERLSQIAAEIAELNTNDVAQAENKVAGLERRKAELQDVINRSRAVVVKYESAKDTLRRIENLKVEQVRLGNELADNEKLLDLIEKFIRQRCGMLTDSINAMFERVTWKLFNVQVNGGIQEVCTCMIPCESGLVAYETANTAAKICADIEIIKVLSGIYEARVPLFVDGAESVNVVPDAGTQTITLSVTSDTGLNIQEVK